jgi:hypothetical protein
LTTGVRVSKKRDLIVHGIIVILYFIALGFNIWGKRKEDFSFDNIFFLQVMFSAKVQVN